MNNIKQTIILFIIILIFGSGLAIYVWNLMQGKNLAEPPSFDLSAYDDMSAFDSIKENLLDPSIQQRVVPAVEIVEDSEEVVSTEESLESNNIYFKKSFNLNTVEETNNLIRSFLDDFAGFEGVEIENFEALNKVEVELPAIDREAVLQALEENEIVDLVEVVEPPVWLVSLNSYLYQDAIVDLFTPYNGVIIKTNFVDSPDYIARVSLVDLNVSEEVLNKLEAEYSDVIKVIRP